MRLQEGVRLNPAEKLNAERSKMRKAVIEISKHKFFGSTRLKNIRFSYRYYAAQRLTLSVYPSNTDVGYTSLKRTYDSFKNGFPRQAKDKTNHSLTTLKNILGTRARVIRSKSDILVLHLIASQLLPAYSIHGFENSLAEFIIRFISKVSKLSQRANEQSKDPYVRYAYFKKFAFLRLQDKYDIMASELLQAIPDLKPRDPNRRFNDTERLAICLKAKETCARCENFTEFEDGQARSYNTAFKGWANYLK